MNVNPYFFELNLKNPSLSTDNKEREKARGGRDLKQGKNTALNLRLLYKT
jgi:hypothetical protein